MDTRLFPTIHTPLGWDADRANALGSSFPLDVVELTAAFAGTRSG